MFIQQTMLELVTLEHNSIWFRSPQVDRSGSMDASVDFLLQNLKELVSYHVNLISNAKNDLEELNKELDRLKAVLKDASRKVKKDETFKVWEKQIREVVYDVEDTIDTCITQIAAEKAKKGGHFRKLFPKKSRVGLAEEVKSLREKKVQPLFKMVNFASITIADEPDHVVAETRALQPKVTTMRLFSGYFLPVK